MPTALGNLRLELTYSIDTLTGAFLDIMNAGFAKLDRVFQHIHI